MKTSHIIMAAALLAVGFSSCKQEEDPKYQAPTTFTVSVPALQDQAFVTATELTSPETFNIFCTQPDYGFSAICSYSVICSLDPNCPEPNPDDAIPRSVVLKPNNSTQAAMAISTYSLGVAMNKMSGVLSEDDADKYPGTDLAKKPYVPVYFRAVCEIPDIEGSRIVSDNIVSYNKVKAPYTVQVPGWIYICGNVAPEADEAAANGFKAPSEDNLADYLANWTLKEPNSLIGEKVYVGRYYMTSKEANPAAANPVDNCSQFRLFTELLGWVNTASFGPLKDDFNVLDVTAQAEAANGFAGEILPEALGNWGIMNTQGDGGPGRPVTIVADMTALKIYIRDGFCDVEFTGRNPEFKPAAN